MTSPNGEVIAEFRAHSGSVTQAMGGALAHLDLLLLHHRGRRSGKSYTTPVSYMPYQDGYLLLGSYAGAATEPQWVGNLENATELTVEVGARRRTMTPTVLRAGPRRDRLYEIARAHWPFVVAYEKKTDRPFPVVQLTPLADAP
jgi:deazaflavin-dependent oxidoreductase (nitroreductase family)